MNIKEFFEMYKDPPSDESKVWQFNVDCYHIFTDKEDLYKNHSDLLEKEILKFTIVNQIDYTPVTVYGRDGMEIYPKTKVYIFTTDWD